MKSKCSFFIFVVLLILAFTKYSTSAVYHIDPGAGSVGDGTAVRPFNKWENLPKMEEGDDVYFRCNTTYKPPMALSIRWEGTSENPVVIGSYYLKNKIPVYFIMGNRPVISGSNYSVPNNIYKGTSNSWLGLIHIASKDYVHIQNLHIFQSGFLGISVSGNLKERTNSAHFSIKNVKVEGSYCNGILINKNPHNYGFIEDCEVSGAAYATQVSGPQLTGAITLTNSPYSYTTVKNNYVHENWGEGISSNRVSQDASTAKSGYATIEDNLVWNNRRVDIYMDGTEGNIVRRNILLGAGPDVIGSFYSTKQEGRRWNQFGIWINAEEGRGEDLVTTSNNSIYNNIIVGHVSGIGIASEYDTGTLENVYFFNNTLIANKNNISIGPKLSGYTMKNVEFKNNISYCPKDAICSDINSDRSWYGSKIKSDYNAWTVQPSNFGGPNDRQVDNNWIRTQGWQNLNGIPDIQDFAMTAGNSAIDKGAVLDDVYKHAIDTVKTSLDPNRSGGISVATIPQDQFGGRWDMGAVIFQNQSAPMAPSRLNIAP